MGGDHPRLSPHRGPQSSPPRGFPFPGIRVASAGRPHPPGRRGGGRHRMPGAGSREHAPSSSRAESGERVPGGGGARQGRGWREGGGGSGGGCPPGHRGASRVGAGGDRAPALPPKLSGFLAAQGGSSGGLQPGSSPAVGSCRSLPGDPSHCYCSQLVGAPHTFTRQIFFAAKAARAQHRPSHWPDPPHQHSASNA